MKLLVILSLATLLAAAPAPQSYQDARLLAYQNENNGVDGYNYAFATSDGTSHESQGEIRNEGTDDEYLAVSGYYTWTAPNGVQYRVKYVADDNGYQPEVEEGPGAPGPVVAALLG